MRGENHHSLFHVNLCLGATEVSSSAHIKLAGLSMHVNFSQARVSEHEGPLRLFPVEVVTIFHLVSVQNNS
jgi:hypothetical protein